MGVNRHWQMPVSKLSKLRPAKSPSLCFAGIVSPTPLQNPYCYKWRQKAFPKILVTLTQDSPIFFLFKRNYPIELGICLLVVICAHLQKGETSWRQQYLQKGKKARVLFSCMCVLMSHIRSSMICWARGLPNILESQALDCAVIVRCAIRVVTDFQKGKMPPS